MRYKSFRLKYRGLDNVIIDLDKRLVPIIGLNESGKSSILQGIAHFDFRNDEQANQKKWAFRNRYDLKGEQPTIVAKVECTEDEVRALGLPFDSTVIDALVSSIIKVGDSSHLEISRNFTLGSSNPYLIDSSGFSDDAALRALIKKLPQAVFIEDFLDGRVGEIIEWPIDFDPANPIALSPDQEILQQIFTDAGIQIAEYIKEPDTFVRASSLEEVSKKFDEKIITAWKKMHAQLEAVNDASRSSVHLVIQEDNAPNRFRFAVEEAVGTGAPTVMGVRERSTGFQWYFNFAAKQHYGPGSNDGSTMYLIDEPGSFLHGGAQSALLTKLAELSVIQAVVFSTHSEALLNPNIINPSNILVVEKKDRAISVTPLSQLPKVGRDFGPLTPAYNALQTAFPVAATLNQKVIITEGVTDTLFWKMQKTFVDIVFLPGCGAGQNKLLISVAIGSAQKYVAIFDGDDAGNLGIKQYEKYYPGEIHRWLKYETSSATPCKLEDLFSSADTTKLLQVTSASDAKNAIPSLFYSLSAADRDGFWSSIDSETEANIDHNFKRIRALL